MPTEEGRRGDEEGDPGVTRDDPTRRREEDPVDGPEPGRARPPLQHPELMAEDDDLEVLGAVISITLAANDEETDEGPDDKVEERPHQPIVPGLSERESGFPTPTGSVAVIGARSQSAGAAKRRSLLRNSRLRLSLPEVMNQGTSTPRGDSGRDLPAVRYGEESNRERVERKVAVERGLTHPSSAG